MPEPDAASAAVSLRAWALEALAGTARPRAAPAASRAGWTALLASEGCALPLLAVLGTRGEHVAGEGAALLRTAATLDLQRYMGARAEASLLGRWAAAEGVRLVVLKGGRAAAAGGARTGMHDLDVLVPAAAAARLAAFLDRRIGFVPDAPAELTGHHLRQRIQPGSLVIEIHRYLKQFPDAAALLERAVPLPLPGLYGLAPDDHLVHLLLHSTMSHPERRGRLRDLVLLADAWNGCSPSEASRAVAEASAREGGAIVAAQLEMARSLAEGRAPGDAFAAEAAARVLLRSAYERARLPRRVARATSDATFALLAGSAELRRYWAGADAGGARLPLRAWRTGRLAAGLALAAPVALAARRAASGA